MPYASFAQEEGEDKHGKPTKHRSQKAIMNGLASPEILKGSTASIHVLQWQSVTDKKVCSSTLMSEAHAMSTGIDSGDRLRAVILCIREQLDTASWEHSINSKTQHLWLSDCNRLVTHSHNPTGSKMEHVRLCIDIPGLRQCLWSDPT